MLKPALPALLLLFAMPAQAEPAKISGKEIHEMVAGSIIEIDTPLGSKLPVQYSESGEMFGQARDIASYLGSSTDTGLWWIDGDQLCHKWEHWFNAEPQCLKLMREGSKIRWRWQDGTTGTATISKKQTVAVAEPRREPVPAQPPRTAPALDTSYRQSLGVSPQRAAREPAVGATADVKPQLASFKVVNVDTSDVLNIRNGPSSDFPAVGEIPPETSGVVMTGPCRSRWCPVRYHNVTGWAKRSFLESEDDATSPQPAAYTREPSGRERAFRDSPDAPRSCLTQAAHALLDRVEEQFGPMQLVSTCRPGATIAGSGRPSKHASGNAVDFDAGSRKQAVVQWLIANHQAGGTMTYSDMDHIHIDIGPHFVSLGAPSGGGGGRYARRAGRWSNG